MSFSHLHVHSQYSLLQASCGLKALAKKAAEYKMPALALTDYGNMFGAVEHYFACKSEGVKPIIGLEVHIAPGSMYKKGEKGSRHPGVNTKLVLLAKNLEGYKNLCKISSAGYADGFYYVPRIDFELLKKYSDNLIALSGSLRGHIPYTLINKGEEAALKEVELLQSIYGENFYLEVNKTGVSDWETVNPFLIQTAKEKNINLVAANDVHYVNQDEQIAQEVLICIGTNKTLQDESRFTLGTDQFYFKSSEQMIELFSQIPEAIENTQKIVDQCNVEFKIKDDKGNPIYHLPTYPTKKGVGLSDEMRRIALAGLEERFSEFEKLGEPVSEEEKPIYFKRIDYELGVINSMGFNGYFLIVQDFIGWAKSKNIPVGPGRGSGAGSLVAYCLRITDLNPIPYNLIFERFLNPERISMPDFDIDFCQANRGRVIDYVTEKYGQASVSQIITYGKLQARAALRDVGRVMGMTFSEVDVMSKLMPDVLGINLAEAIDTEPRIKELMDSDPKMNTLMELSQKIEGITRHAGIHAAGVVIADGDIVNISPLYKGNDGENVVQYDMKHAEKKGLIKFDFLGLKTLTHIDNCFKLIEKNRGKKLSTNDISLKDDGIYKLLIKGDTKGIFQFESDGITDLITKSKPTIFEDLVAITALYRPGPMEMIPDYIKRKKGDKKIKYTFPEIESLVKETYGIIVYQEQVQLIAAKVASYSLGEADLLRRAMGKKDPVEMAKQKKRFMSGADNNGFDIKKSEELFDSMAEFAKYGFNKSHAAAYCVISAQTAWLKYYYPVEFLAALLSTEMRDTEKVVRYIKDARKHNIEVCPPNINFSEFAFTVNDEKIMFSLGAIKGVGEAAIDSITEARAEKSGKRFESLEDFFNSVDLRKVNKKTIECLIKAGALDEYASNRAELMNGYGLYLERADQSKKDKETGQFSLFSLDEEIKEQEKVVLEKVDPWRKSARLYYEKEVMGFYLSDHPMKGYEKIIKRVSTCTIDELSLRESKSTVKVTGMISGLREIITKKGTRMCFASLEDMSGSTELVVFPDAYAASELILKGEGILIVEGALELDENKNSKLLVNSIKSLDSSLASISKLIFNVNNMDTNKLSLLKEVICKSPGATKMKLRLKLEDLSKYVELDLEEPSGVGLSVEFLENLLNKIGDTKFIEFS